jgi:hypothetical protein
MDIAQRNSEDQAPQEQAWDVEPTRAGAVLAASKHMVALVDRVEKWLDMLFSPGFFGSRHEH